MSEKLLAPVTLGKLALRNRVVMAPMSRNRATPEGLATDLMATYYGQRAGAGLIITEGVQPSVTGQGFGNSPGLHTQAHAESWKPVTDAVHAKGGLIVAQLMHCGRIGHPSLYPSGHQSVAPSAVAAAGQAYGPEGPLDYPEPRALTVEEIAEVVKEHADAAELAIEAGFDGVEIHAGNGFLLHQFLAENTNQRTDQYGGSVENRIRFAIEVIEAVSERIGADRVGVRISPSNPYNDIVEGDTHAIYEALIAALPPIAFLHVLEGGNRDHITAIRAQWTGTIVLCPHPENGVVVNAEVAEAALEAGVACAVAFGASFIANPDLPERIRTGAALAEADQSKFYGGDHTGYTDYPTLEGTAA
ncbi:MULTISPECIES: alkene reductase [Streptomyces]|uniref:1,2-oxophytodienoate reductase n=1 Tax=Streptomyces katrae TaxID=68223 RepID=A0A0F4JRT4_9ACTN|nr:alkene reductase [Streptomyces katrae]KJY35656.1 1,2-oxophytodienoate reductase [Streptomyces katrae]MCF3179865.1 alkene reductase [Streptomyces polychromogenes]